MRRLAFIIWTMGPGGAERVVSLLGPEFARRGDDVHLVTVATPEDDFFSIHPAISRTGLGLEGRNGNGVQQVRTNLTRFKALRATVRAIRPHIVLSFLETTNLHTLMACRGLGVPVIVSVRANPEVYPRKRLHRTLRRLLYPRAAAVVLQTEAAAQWARGFLPKERVFAIPNPVGRASGPERRPEPMVVAVGRMDRDKGFDLLLDAFSLCVQQHPGWRLVIAGTGPDRTALEEQARTLGMHGLVEFPGLISDPGELLARASIFVLSSRTEGFPNVLLEAMAAGVPVVAAECGPGPREIVRDGEDGVLVPPEDPPELARAMERLMDSASERERLGGAARAVVDRFGISTVADRWEAVFAAVEGVAP